MIRLIKSYISHIKKLKDERIKAKSGDGFLTVATIAAIVLPLWWLFLILFFGFQHIFPYIPNIDLLSQFHLPAQALHTKEITIQENKLLIRLGFPFNRVQVNDLIGNNIVNFSPRQHLWGKSSFFVTLPNDEGYLDCINQGDRGRYNLYDARGNFVRTEKYRIEEKSVDQKKNIQNQCLSYESRWQAHNQFIFETNTNWSEIPDSELKTFIKLYKPIYAGGKVNMFNGKYSFYSIFPFGSDQLYRIVDSRDNLTIMLYTDKSPSTHSSNVSSNLQGATDFQRYEKPMIRQEQVRANPNYQILNDVSYWQLIIVILTSWFSLFIGIFFSLFFYCTIRYHLKPEFNQRTIL